MNNKLEVIGIDHGWSMMKTMGDYYEEDKYYLIIRSTGLFNGCL